MISNLDPLKNGYWGNDFGYAEMLMKPELSGAPRPWLLQSLTNPSRNTWVLTLRSGEKFQNGTPLDAKALVACMQYQMEHVALDKKSLAGMTIAATGPEQVTLTTAEPTPNMPYVLAGQGNFIIYDQAAYNTSKGNEAKMLAAKMYTGPYEVQSLSTQELVATPNPNYWGSKPALSKVTVKFVSDAVARIEAVEHGEADIALYPPTQAAATLKGSTTAFVTQGDVHGPTFELFMNQREFPFNDVKVRQALQSAIDYNQIATQVMDGNYVAALSMYSSTASYAVNTQSTNVAKAQQIFAQDGWTKDSSGILAKDGKELTITVDTYPQQQPDSATLATAVQSQLSAIGVKVNINPVPDINATTDQATGWDSAVIGDGMVSLAGDPVSILTSYFASTGSANISGIKNPALDTLVNQLAVTPTGSSTYNSLLQQTQQIIADNADIIFLGQRKPTEVVGKNWQGYSMNEHFANLWVLPDTAPTS